MTTDTLSSPTSPTCASISSIATYIDPLREKKLTRKIDRYLISLFGLLYLCCFLCRVYIGNANVASPSISESLGLSAAQFNACVSVFYATYVVSEPIWANLLKILTPKVVLAGTTLAWGAITLGAAWVKAYGDLIVCRILLGVFEAALFPCIMVYIMSTYRREECAVRIAYIFSCAALAGAFGGLMAYGLVRINSDALADGQESQTGDLVGWQYLFLIQGIISFVLGPLTYFWVPNRMDEAWFLSRKEREGAQIRYALNKAHYDPDAAFSWTEAARAARDWKVYASGAIQFSGNVASQGMSTFMPAIIRGMGFSNVRAQLMTVPVYFLAAASFIAIAHLSDRFRVRSPFLVGCLVLQITGYGVLAGTTAVGARYAGVFIAALGMYSVPGLNLSWIGGNTSGHYKRASALGLNQLIGVSAGACVGTIYHGSLAPLYRRSLIIAAGIATFALCVVLAKAFALHKINQKRERLRAAGAPDEKHLGDDSVHFV